MKRIIVGLTILSVLALFSCSKSPNNPVDRSEPGSATVNIQLGKVGALAKSSALAKSTAISLSKLYITLTAQGEPTINDTISLSSGSSQANVTKTYGPLASIKEWTLTAASIDQNDSTIHSGTQTFSVKPKQTLNLPTLALNAIYSMLTANFYPIQDSVTRCQLLVNGSQVAIVSFAKQSRVGDTIPVKLTFDYLRTNVAQRIKMNAFGDINGVDTLLYSVDTLITPLPGANAFYIVALKWVGPALRPAGQASINVVLGAIGTTTLQGSLQPDNRLWGNVVNLAAGADHSLFLKSDGTLWACGFNREGELGDGTTIDRHTPVQIMNGVQAIAVGLQHSLILKSNGTLWACGYNHGGELGDGTTIQRNTPVQVMSGVQAIAAGGQHSLILKTDSTLWACGNNSFGQLGDGTTIQQNTPVQVMSGVRAIAAGGGYTFILKSNGSLFACGSNFRGELGDGTNVNRYTPVQIMSDVKAIATEGEHSLILKSNGELWACGNNSYGQLGVGDTASRYVPVQIINDVMAIAAGEEHSLILKSDGTLWACGHNSYGQLGIEDTTSHYTPVQIMSDVRVIAAGYEGSFILKSNATLWACGRNYIGQLGDGTTIDRHTPVQIIF
jgi:alpha-tubulin suppressor-like RCC1 family protein